MKRYLCILLVSLWALQSFPAQSHGGHGHGSDWDEWVAAMSLGLLGMGLWMEMTRPQYPPLQIYMQQQVPVEPLKPGYMYFCVSSGGYYPYIPGCPGGWLRVVPVPQPQPQKYP